MGADAAVGLESWREPERVVELARLAIARRSGIADAEVAAVLRSLGAEGRATMLEMPAVRRLLLGGARARRSGPAAALPRPRAGRRFIEEKGIYA